MNNILTIGNIEFDTIGKEEAVIVYIEKEDECSTLIEDEFKLDELLNLSNVGGVMRLNDFKNMIIRGMHLLSLCDPLFANLLREEKKEPENVASPYSD